MLDLLWLIPALPLGGFVLLALLGGRMARAVQSAIGVGSIGLAAVVSIGLAVAFLGAPPPGGAYRQVLWTWMSVGGFSPSIGLYLDALSLVMVLVVTGVGFLIHLYSTEYMGGEAEEGGGYRRFFAAMNLFVASMLVLVLADNLVLLYLGWEGVGLCSYLLIGFWYRDPANVAAANKAFIVTRIGDTATALGLFLLFHQLGTLDIQEVMRRASLEWAPGSRLAVAAAALLLGGAVGKSAQLPLQTWLPDAMAGPTPVSALIHAATMVTAGVYLIARTHGLFTLAPQVLAAVAIIGALTQLLAGLSALTQRDIKRTLAWSTISQIGFMFLALGVGAFSAAIFHFMTHAFFKALLFLAAGAVILSLHHEQDMFRMGGLRRELPLTFWTFLIGAASLASLPLVTAGFYSKEAILSATWASPAGSWWLWAAAIVGALITAIYTFRLVFLTFFGPVKTPVTYRPGLRVGLPLVALAFLSTVGGFIDLPPSLGGRPLLSEFLHTALPPLEIQHVDVGLELGLQGVAAAVSLLGVGVAWQLFLRRPQLVDRLLGSRPMAGLHRWWFTGWGFDWLYDRLFVRPFLRTAEVSRSDFIDLLYRGIAWLHASLHALLSRTESGLLRWYAASIAAGAAAVVAIAVFL